MKHKASEHNEQVALVRKLRTMGYFVAAVPNGGKRDVREATRMKQEVSSLACLTCSFCLMVVGSSG